MLIDGPADDVDPVVTTDGLLLWSSNDVWTGGNLLASPYAAPMPLPGGVKRYREPSPIASEPGNQVEAAILGTTGIVVYSDNRSGQYDLRAVRLVNGRPRGSSWLVVADGYAR